VLRSKRLNTEPFSAKTIEISYFYVETLSEKKMGFRAFAASLHAVDQP